MLLPNPVGGYKHTEDAAAAGRQQSKSPLPPIINGHQSARSPSPTSSVAATLLSRAAESPTSPAAGAGQQQLLPYPPTSPRTQSQKSLIQAPDIPSPITEMSVPPCPIVLVFGTSMVLDFSLHQALLSNSTIYMH